ncbi:MAG TPA: CARDB domain-containing protein [Solirubrobacteraceae bacterium]
MPSHRRYLLIRLLLACAAITLSCGFFAGQALAAAPPCADLYLENVSVSPTNPVVGMPATVTLTVHNGGTCAAGGFVTQFRTSLKSQTGPSESINSLNAGESRTLELPFVFTAAGNYEAVVETDTGNAVSETNEANNLEILSITVLPPGINLVLEEFTVKPVESDPTESVVQGRPAIATIKVTNTGNVPAGAFVVSWTPYVFGKPLTKTVSGLAPGESTTVTMEYTFPTATTVTGTALADSTHVVKETDELDNSKTLKTVVQPPLPNLRVARVSDYPAPAGSESEQEVEIENNGNSAAGDFVVTWKPGLLVAQQSQQVNGLGEGERTIVFFTENFKTAGTYSGTVTLDSTHVIKEVNPNEQTASTLFVIPGATVDLTITGLTIEPEYNRCGCDCNNCDSVKPAYSANTIVQAVPDRVTVDVKNLGNSPSPSFVTSWNPSANSIIVPGNQTLTQESGPLGPGEERELEYHFTYPKPGNFRSVAEVNAFKTVKETNESNNQKILNVTVEPARIYLEFAGPITPSPNPLHYKEAGTETVKVINYGPIATGSFAVQLEPQEKGIKQTKIVPGLNVGEETTLTYTVTYGKAGAYTATAVIDPFDQVVKAFEPVEESETINVAPVDLGFVGGITVNPNPIFSKEAGTESVTVRDFGPGGTNGPFSVQLASKEKGVKQTKVVSGGLKSGEQITLTFPVEYGKAGSYTATAVIDPFNQVNKTTTPDEESEPINVEATSASLNVKLNNFQALLTPGGYEEWKVIELAKSKGYTCTFEFEDAGKKIFDKTLENIGCDETGEQYEENEIENYPSPVLPANLHLNVTTEEGGPAIAASVALTLDKNIFGDIVNFGLPGFTTFITTPSEYLHPSGPKTVEGTGCAESNKTEVNKGHCYNAEYELELLSHVGMAAVQQQTLAAVPQQTLASDESSVNQSASEIGSLWREAGADAAKLSDKHDLRVHLTQRKR